MMATHRRFDRRTFRPGNWTEILEARTLLSAAYTFQDLGALPGGPSYSMATGINDAGEVVGNSGGGGEAFLWTPSQGMVALALSSNYSVATGINNSGQVSGMDAMNSPNDLAVVWNTNGTIQEQSLGTLPGVSSSWALGINTSGEVVGYSGRDAFTWTSTGGIQSDDPYPTAAQTPAGTGNENVAINNAGQIAATTYTSGNGAAYALTPNGVTTNLGNFLLSPGNMIATAINDTEEIVGSVNNDQAIRWSPAGVQTLGNMTNALGINDAGAVVGYTETGSFNIAYNPIVVNPGAVSPLGVVDYVPPPTYAADLWTASGGVQNLNSLIPANTGFTLQEATAINNEGQIVGYGLDSSGETHAFLLTPVDHLVFTQEPPQWADSGMIAGPMAVAIENQSNQIVTSDDSTITLSIATGPSGTLAGSTYSDTSYHTSTTVVAVNGIATFANLNVTGFGTFTLAASDGGDAPATSTPVYNPMTATVTLTSSDVHPNVGQAVTFSGTVTGGGNTGFFPTGTVTLTAGQDVIGTATLGTSGASGTFSITANAQSAWASDEFMASYSGDSNFAPANVSSSTVTEDVTPASPLQASLQVNPTGPIVAGQGSSVMATVSLKNTGSVAIHGKVQELFYASATGSFDGNAVELPVILSKKLALKPGKQITQQVRLYFPPNATPGISGLILQATDPAGGTTIASVPDCVNILKPYVHLAGIFSQSQVTVKPGSKTNATIIITNTGNAIADGMVTIALQASTTGVFDSSAGDALRVTKKIDVGPDKSQTIRLTGLALPTEAGKYYLVADLEPNGEQIPEVDSSLNTFVSVLPVKVK